MSEKHCYINIFPHEHLKVSRNSLHRDYCPHVKDEETTPEKAE